MRILWVSVMILLALAFSGCVPSQPGEPVGDVQPSDLPDASSQGDTMEMPPTIPADSSLQNLIERAKEDLAQRLNILLTEIRLVDAKAVTWPDASLGCPQPGMLYKQVPEDGALIILQAKGITYEYHNGGSRGLFLCEKVQEKPSPPPQIDLLNLTPSSTGPSVPDSATPDNGIPPGENQ